MKVDSAYISVENRQRAETYWKRVFGTEPVMKNETFIFFDVGGFLFGLFDPSTVDEEVKNGNNCILNLRVEDADAEAVRLGEFSKIVMPVSSVGSIRVFQVEDTEGNVVEFYSESIGG
ncbi:MAG: VOC family protein [Chloroflexi bacterium]|nr:VOC family protein [Chloroflexota bacterium]